MHVLYSAAKINNFQANDVGTLKRKIYQLRELIHKDKLRMDTLDKDDRIAYVAAQRLESSKNRRRSMTVNPMHKSKSQEKSVQTLGVKDLQESITMLGDLCNALAFDDIPYRLMGLKMDNTLLRSIVFLVGGGITTALARVITKEQSLSEYRAGL